MISSVSNKILYKTFQKVQLLLPFASNISKPNNVVRIGNFKFTYFIIISFSFVLFFKKKYVEFL